MAMQVEMARRPGHPAATLAEIQARWNRWREWHEAGATAVQIAAEFGVTPPAVRHAVRQRFIARDTHRRRTEQVLPMGVLQLQELVASRLRRE